MAPLAVVAVSIVSLPLAVLHPSLRHRLHPDPIPSNHPDALVPRAPTYLILKAFNLYIASIVISITSVLNFSLAASLAILLGAPLAFTKPGSIVRFTMMVCLTPMSLLTLAGWHNGTERVLQLFERTVWEWQVLGVWFFPFACCVYLPIVLQGAVVCLLPAE